MSRRASYDAIKQKVIDDVDRVGWSAIAVFPTGEDPGWPYSYPFIYTIGFALRGWPDVIVVGLPHGVGHQLCHNAFEQMKEGGPWVVGQERDDVLESFTMRVGSVSPDRRDEHLTITGWYYDRVAEEVITAATDDRDRLGIVPWKAVQIVWPDAVGKFPDDELYDFEGCPQVLLDD